jgi:two-component system OmpR family sensor kinase
VFGVVLALLSEAVPAWSGVIVYTRADVGSLALVVGLSLSGLAAAGSWLWQRGEQRCQQRVAGVRTQVAAERRRFLQRLDHELKNPITAIRAGLANAMNGSTMWDRREALASVEAQALRISHLAADLRKLAELETRTLEQSPVDLAELLREAVSLAEEQPGAKSRALSLTLPQVPWPLPAVQGDRDLLFLAVYNLLDNAVKFTRDGDAVEVRAFEDRAAVVIEVADTGPGIEEDEVPRVWEELYRGQAAGGVAGSGLGLALARAVIERHRGRVGLRSRIGQGTVVTLRLPLA